jgi:hypothetical protein
MRMTFAFLAGFWLLAVPALAMDRWAALSMLESGDNDKAIGSRGEISRFQVKRAIWPGGNSRDPQVALAAAQGIMRPRLEKFQQDQKRPATDYEFYVLWNAPATISHPPLCVIERARRFANLVSRNVLLAKDSTPKAAAP